MQPLNDQQLAQLRKFIALANVAFSELDDAMGTGFMSDAKSAVYAMVTAADELDVPDEVASRLRELAKESWSGVVGPGDAYERTSRGISPIGEIERFIASVLEAAGAGPL